MSPNDPRLYSVDRDVAHNFGAVMELVAERLEDGRWDALDALLKEKGVSDDEQGEACKALLLFVADQVHLRRESMARSLERCGWLDLNPYARVAVMAHLGTVILGMHWAGVREATLGGNGPAQTMQDLRACGKRCALLMTLPRWRRTLYKWRGRLRRAWSAWKKQ